MEKWEHGVLEARLAPNGAGKIEFISARDDETVDAEYASIRRQTNALNVLSEDGCEVAGMTAVADGGMTVTRYLVRRPKRQTHTLAEMRERANQQRT